MKNKFFECLALALVLTILVTPSACGGGEVTPPSGEEEEEELVAPTPAEFEVISLDIKPTEVMPGETVTITAVVENAGGSEGTYATILTVDGVTEETEEVTITAGSSRVVTFFLVKDTPGTYEIGVGGLSSSLVVSESTPVVAETISGAISDPEGDVAFGFIDIVSVELTVEGEEVVAQIKLSELPETLIFNQAPERYLEYTWSIYFDADGDPSTGAATADCIGADYILEVSHWSSGEVEEYTIPGRCQINVWKSEDTNWTILSWATAETDYTTNTLTIRGTVPGLNTDSRWFAYTYYWDTASEKPYNDRAPDTDFALLLEE